MSPTFQIQVYCKQRPVFTGAVDGPIEIGRQQKADEPLFVPRPATGGLRMAVARLEESVVSRAHLRLEPIGAVQVRAINLSSRNGIVLEDGTTLTPNASRELRMPALLSIADVAIRVEPIAAEEPDLQTLAQPTLLPKRGVFQDALTLPLPMGPVSPREKPDRNLLDVPPVAAPRGIPPLPTEAAESVVAWLQTVIEVLQSAASSTDFFARAAEAVVNLVGLDSGCVLLFDGETWRNESRHFSSRLAADAGDQRPSQRILSRMRDEKRTFWHAPATAGRAGEHSLTGIQAVVVSPLLDPAGRVIGALYGDRRRTGADGAPSITRLEAMIVETLACGVAAGLSRLDQQKQALAARVQFEQFFTPELARQLTLEPDLLKGRDAEVSLVFSDIRGFSRISDRLGPAGTVAWLSDVMGTLSDCVIARQGVLVDYIGDELIAMWGAPVSQPDHARLACQAAIEMWRAIPALNERWKAALGEPFALGIGVNTGIARVGNMGSHRKFKYGPLGSTVNLASRAQGATKYLKAEIVVTAAAYRNLGSEFAGRRLGKVRVVNIAEPIEFYELRDGTDAEWRNLCRAYETGLGQYERQDFRGASTTLSQLLAQYPDDGPTVILLARAASHIFHPDEAFSDVWELPGK